MNEIKELKTWQKFFGIILSIILFFIITICISLHFTKQLLNEEFYYKILSNIDYEKIINDENIQEKEFQKKIIKYIESHNIDKLTAINFLSNDKVNRLTSKFISDWFKNLVYAEDINSINIDEINNILDETNIKDEDIRKNIIYEVTKINNEISTHENNNSNIYIFLKKLFNYDYISIILIISLVSFFIFAFIINDLINPLKYIGISYLFSGSILTFISYVIHKLLMSLIVDLNISDSSFNIVGKFTYYKMYYISLGLIIIGFILTTAKTRIVKKRMLNNNNMIINN